MPNETNNVPIAMATMSSARLCLGAEASVALTGKGPFLFGAKPGMADAMFAPVVTRFLTYDVKLDSDCASYCQTIMAMPAMQEWVDAAKAEPDEVVELDVEF
jgi:glutathione S-transferase